MARHAAFSAWAAFKGYARCWKNHPACWSEVDATARVPFFDWVNAARMLRLLALTRAA
jgi:hypothetical protein